MSIGYVIAGGAVTLITAMFMAATATGAAEDKERGWDEMAERLTIYIASTPYTFVLTCGSCPEQWNVFADDGDAAELVGYVRLRSSRFTVEFPWVGGELLTEGTYDPDGSGLRGSFDEADRLAWLTQAARAINERRAEPPGPAPAYPPPGLDPAVLAWYREHLPGGRS